MKAIFLSDLHEMMVARWYRVYVLSFTLFMTVFLVFGLAESKILGFTGLGRTLLTFIQLCLVIIPIFCLVTTARTFVSDRESGVWEYMLSLPVELKNFYWGKAGSRLLSLAAPLVITILLMALLALVRGKPIPWFAVFYYQMLLVSMVACFLGIALLISILSLSQETSLASAFLIWLSFEAMIDGLLLGLLVKEQLPARVVIGLALLNPLQAFRVAAISLFDPQLTSLGPISFTIFDHLGGNMVLIWAVVWPVVLGLICAWWGARSFLNRDLV